MLDTPASYVFVVLACKVSVLCAVSSLLHAGFIGESVEAERRASLATSRHLFSANTRNGVRKMYKTSSKLVPSTSTSSERKYSSVSSPCSAKLFSRRREPWRLAKKQARLLYSAPSNPSSFLPLLNYLRTPLERASRAPSNRVAFLSPPTTSSSCFVASRPSTGAQRRPTHLLHLATALFSPPTLSQHRSPPLALRHARSS